MIAFLDASALIDLIEGAPPFARRVRAQLADLEAEHPAMGAAVSRLSWLECRVGPLKPQRPEALAAFDAFFARLDLVWIELDRQVILLTGVAAFERVAGLRVALLAP